MFVSVLLVSNNDSGMFSIGICIEAAELAVAADHAGITVSLIAVDEIALGEFVELDFN